MLSRIHKFVSMLLEHGIWDRLEAEAIADFTKPEWTESITQHFLCAVCGVSIHKGIINYNYMLYDSVWLSAGFKHSEFAHIGCFEQKLGRELVQEDFQRCPMNGLIHWMFDNKIQLPKG